MIPCSFFLKRLALMLAPLLMSSLCAAVEPGQGARMTEDRSALTIATARYRMVLDRRNGALRSLEDKSARGGLLSGGGPLWSLERRNDSPVSSTVYLADGAAGRFRYEWSPESSVLRLIYQGADADVEIACHAAEESLDWRCTVHLKRGIGLRWDFPAGLNFDGGQVKTFYFPHDLGVGFTKEFFEPNDRAWKRSMLGSKALEFLTGERLQMRPVRDEGVALKATDEGAKWLPQWYRTEMAKWRVAANRCPQTKTSDAVLATTANGDWLAGYQIGGWGWLFRLGGILRRDDFRPAFASVMATLSWLHGAPPSVRDSANVSIPKEYRDKAPSQWPVPPRRIGVLSFQPRLNPGVRMESGPLKWMAELKKQTWIKEKKLEVVAITDLDTLGAALGKPRDWFAIINPLGEGFPAANATQWQETLTAIREYVRNGGIWWEAGGGYSFHHVLIPDPDASLTALAADLFSDFAHLDSAGGRWSLYGVQPEDAIFVAPQMTISASGPAAARMGTFSHAFMVYIPEGAAWQSPLLRMTVGRDMRSDLAQYGAENKYTRRLEDKVKPGTLATLKRAVLVKLTQPTLAEQIKAVDQIPVPSLVHISNYLHGGFDKQYPDHLPPNPKVGTAEELKRLIDRCHERGHLFMPYTNPTWWCAEPKGPTFERVGEAPLSRDLDGKIIPEAYGSVPNRGYTICGYHPAVRAANQVTRDQFTRQYPSDVLFEDQVGARKFRYDTNPAAPNPAAYLQGIHGIAREDCAAAPLGTEDGHDRLINYETMFCGVSWPWLPNLKIRQRVLYDDLWPHGAFRIEPLAAYLAHDKVLFTHHDLGGFILDRNDMVQSLALGYGMSLSIGRLPSEDLGAAQWLDCLGHIQRSVASRYAGQPLEAFEYVTRDVTKSRWGGGLELIANLGDAPYDIDEKTTLAPRGFHATANGLDAGIYTRYEGKDRDPWGWWLIRERSGDQWDEWTFTGDRQEK